VSTASAVSALVPVDVERHEACGRCPALEAIRQIALAASVAPTAGRVIASGGNVAPLVAGLAGRCIVPVGLVRASSPSARPFRADGRFVTLGP